MFTIPQFDFRFRLIIIVMSVGVLIWSGLEDHGVTGVVGLGWLVAIIGVSAFITAQLGNMIVPYRTLMSLSPLLGAIVGAAASICVALLMIFKDVRHAHVFPDYPPQMILDILAQLPIWAISGALVMMGSVGFWRVYRDMGDIESHNKNQTNTID